MYTPFLGSNALDLFDDYILRPTWADLPRAVGRKVPAKPVRYDYAHASSERGKRSYGSDEPLLYTSEASWH